MADRVPPGAFSEAAKQEQILATNHLGGPKKAFDSRSTALGAMRTAVNEHDVAIAQLKEDLANLPFPFAVRS